MAELLVRTIDLDCSVSHAFDVFISKIDLWWPRGHRKTRDGTLRLDAVAGGVLVARGPDGSEWTMARVTGIDPPRLLALDWYPGSPVAPTSVEVRFVPRDGGTTITVTHRPLADSAAIWPQRVAQFTAGWEAVLPAFESYMEET